MFFQVALACAFAAPRRLLSLTLSNAAARGGLVANVKGWRDVLAQEGQSGWSRRLMESRFHPGALDPGLHAWYLRVHETCSMDATLGLADLLLGADQTPRQIDADCQSQQQHPGNKCVDCRGQRQPIDGLIIAAVSCDGHAEFRWRRRAR